MAIRRIIISLAILVIYSGAFAQQNDHVFPEEARKRLDYAIGKWRSKSEYLDQNGNVTRITHSEDERRYVIDDRVVEITVQMEESGSTFRAWEYYNIREKKYTFTSIDKKGTLWTMKGDLGEKFIWTSDFKELPDGRTVAMRFTHYDFEKNSFSALGERTSDGGKTWIAFSRQYLTRIGK